MGNDIELKIDARPFAQDPLRMRLLPSATVGDLRRAIASDLPLLDLNTVKLLGTKGRSIKFSSVNPEELVLDVVGNHDGKALKFKLMASTREGVTSIQQSRELAGLPSFDHEEQRARRRQETVPTTLKLEETRFKSFKPWEPSGMKLFPEPSEALKLLHRISMDAGILGVMKKHNWRVGTLSELPPEGYVGVSPVCVLGLNRNAGQEICLRLRTDDLQGFRRYDRIRETLIHELAHNVFPNHDRDFKELNSKLNKEMKEMDWRNSPEAKTVSGSRASSFAPTLIQTSQEGQGITKGKITGFATNSRAKSGKELNPKEAAAAAAEKRAIKAGLRSHPIERGPDKPSSPPQKGEEVEYRQRDGSWIPAKVIAVDFAIMPPSYAIEMINESGEIVHRDTELNRLRKIEKNVHELEIQGLGHHHVGTEAAEDKVKFELE